MYHMYVRTCVMCLYYPYKLQSILSLKTLVSVSECGLNVHKRCKHMVSSNCGVNQVELASLLGEMQMSPGKIGSVKRKPSKVNLTSNSGSISSSHSTSPLMTESNGSLSPERNHLAGLHGCKLTVADLTFLKVLGKGSFGKVSHNDLATYIYSLRRNCFLSSCRLEYTQHT